ncbi:glutamine-hydrolyzing carbamoyl-phosphate synthase small subunit [bacterium]|nr:glutamine-hydrolyzing carbamoyl-phosphate synthase small subunit [bacterium]
MQAYLILANGMVFKGRSLGCQGTTVGEVVFATGMVGFEETLTDPSYYGQIITQTYPLIGNYGMNRQDQESDRVWAKGYIVREACTTPSNFRSEETLDTFLKDQGIIGIEGIDTRALTRVLRESGVMNGAITTEFDPEQQQERLSQLMPAIRKYAVTGAVAAVTCTEPQRFAPTAGVAQGEEPLHIALLDLGCKNNIVRCLCKRGCRVTVLPGTTTPAELAALDPDGLMLSNGPGDPAENVEIIANIRAMLDTGIPAFGICLGHQLTALAAGAKTCKMKYGHRGANQPVTDFALERTFITSQNHGYAVLGNTLPQGVGRVSHVNANDKTCEGIEYQQWNCFTVQFHPEANGGPKDTEFLFDRFLQNVRRINRVKGGR